MRDGQRRSSSGRQGGAGGRGPRRNDGRDNPNKLNVSNAGRATPGPMSPPPRPSSAAATPTPTPTQTPTPTPTIDLHSPITKREPAYYYYEFLTEERMTSWEASGRAEVIARGTQARQDEDPMDLSSVMQELTRASLDNRIDTVDAGNCLKEILGPQILSEAEPAGSFDPHSLFLDVVSVMCEAEDGPIKPCLKSLFIASGISATTLRQRMDATLLESLGLTRDSFSKVNVRQATNLLYRQANYNLLREETEGYSKLITELFTTSGSEPPAKEVVEETFERVKALIGTFDLDVGRVLDLTLDVFAAVLVKHYRFFVKLLRLSSWWPRAGDLESTIRHGGLPSWALPSSPGWMPTEEDDAVSKEKRLQRDLIFWDRAREVGLKAFFELGGTALIGEEMKQRLLNVRGNGDADLEADKDWIEKTGTLPPSGNRVAAQLLGFKLRFYTSEARDKEDVLPANLIYLAALLIKIGFISLRDLYPHLWPLDEVMPALIESKRAKQIEEEKLARGGGDNALTRAGALSDDSAPPTSRTREPTTAKPEPTVKPVEVDDKDKLEEPSDQKVQLLTCLLTIGAVPEAMYILGKFPGLLDVYPDLVDLVNRILNHSIDQVYRACKPVSNFDKDFSTKRVAVTDQSGMPKGQLKLTEVPVKKQLRWPFPDKWDTNECTSYRFYWDEWADNVPVCQNVADVITLCDTFVNLVGPSIGKDANLLSKIVRIGRKNISDDGSPQNLRRWEILLKRLIVPALSITKGNTQIANEIWSLLQIYSVHDRYSIYNEWFLGATSRTKAIKAVFDRTEFETKNIMKRISKNNISTMARTLAKVSFSSPGIAFREALKQIEAYNNLVEVVVECAKYFSDLGFDVLVWALTTALGTKKVRTNSSFALLPSKWLLALSTFSGKVYKRYSIMDLAPVLRYVNFQLYNNNATDLVILKELISQMAGVYPSTDYGNDSIIAMTGGEKLRKYTLIELLDQRHVLSRTGHRLMENFINTKLVGELLIAIAQYRQAYIYQIPDKDAHIKLLATMIDDTHAVLSQYLDFLRHNLSVEQFDQHVPSIPELIADFGLHPELAFLIGRVSVAYHKSSHKSIQNGVVRAITPPAENVDGEGDINMNEESSVTVVEDSVPDPGLINGVIKEDTPMTDVKEEEHTRSASVSEPQSPTIASGNTISAIIETVKSSLPESTFRTISPEFYVTFWISALHDINVPQLSYKTAVDRLMDKEKEVTASASSSRDPRSSRSSRESEKQALSEVREGLIDEMKKLVVGFGSRKARFLKNKADWFLSSAKGDDISDTFLEKCLLPRLLLSPVDAEYSFKMTRFLHDNGVPHFRTLSLYNRFFKSNRLRTLIFTCTVREAENLGRFIRLALVDLARWHADPALYRKEAHGTTSQLIGFAKSVDEDGNPKGQFDYDGEKGFKNLLWKWHQNLNTAIRDCLEGTEWMHIRNAFTILRAVTDVFPAVDFQGNAFKKQLETIIARETGVREDLTLTANTILGFLKKKSPGWVMVQAFHSMVYPIYVHQLPQANTV
jgi:THO complex subunit 2